MGYALSREQAIAPNIHRILDEQVQAARQALNETGQAKGEAIHGVRKRIKKIRALVRLVKSELKKDDFKRVNAHYRTIGQTLSPLRDATVMIKTLDKLRQSSSPQIAPAVFATLNKTLTLRQDQASRAFFDDPVNIGAVAEAFRQAPTKLTGLGKHQRSFSFFGPNLKDVYRRGRRALHVANHEASIDKLHELRKDVKTIWYHTRLLEPIWPGVIGAYEHEFGQLGELLGDDHDFGVLAMEIESDRLTLRNIESKERILQALHGQRTAIQDRIYPLANRLFAEKPHSFVDHYRLYWKLWQKEPDEIKQKGLND